MQDKPIQYVWIARILSFVKKEQNRYPARERKLQKSPPKPTAFVGVGVDGGVQSITLKAEKPSFSVRNMGNWWAFWLVGSVVNDSPKYCLNSSWILRCYMLLRHSVEKRWLFLGSKPQPRIESSRIFDRVAVPRIKRWTRSSAKCQKEASNNKESAALINRHQ